MKINIELWTRTLRSTFIGLSVLAIALAVVYAIALFYVYSFDRDPKNWTNAISFYGRPDVPRSESTALGSLIVRGNGGNLMYATRYELYLADIKPSALHDCLMAAEDKRFYGHTGIDYFGISSALLNHFVAGRRLRGASTITNQLIGEVILADRSRKGLRGLWRKFEELILTNVTERHFSKDDLLLAYVNNVPVGSMNGQAMIGLSAASKAILGKKDPKTLTLSEACTLAGMLNRPNGYIKEALNGDYGRIRKHRNAVLENLRLSNPERYSHEAIVSAENEEIRFFKLTGKPPAEPRQFMGYAHQQLGSAKPGTQIFLTVDVDLQRAAVSAVNNELARFDNGLYGSYNRISYNHAIKQGLKITAEDSKLQAALVALDPKTGEILAMVAGRNATGEFNRATQAKRAPGSVIKPFLYLCGVVSGSLNGRPFGPDSIIDPAITPAAQRYSTGGAAPATVQLARSDNGAAVAITQGFGISRVRNFIARVAGTNPVESELIAIGAGKGMELSPLDLAVAYTIFPNNGAKSEPNPISAVYENGTRLTLSKHKPIRLADADAASVVTRMLQSVIGDGPDGQYGTARMARKLSDLDSNVALAGKTGTGDNDLWFVGFTPRILVVVWAGFDNNFPPFGASKGFTGSGLPLQIWGKFMVDVKKYRPDLLAGKFEKPVARE